MVKAATKAQVPAVRETAGQVAPAFMQDDINRGKENISAEDIEIPRLVLIQALSPQLEEYNKLRPGNFFHSGAEHIFAEPFRAVPIYYERRFMLWRPRDDGGGILARSDDGVHWSPPDTEFNVKLDKKDGGQNVTWATSNTVEASGLAEWGSTNPKDPRSPPAATKMLSFLLGFPDHHPELGPAALTFQRSSIKVGRKFLTKIKTIRAPIFGMVFEFGPADDKNGSGQKYFNIGVKGAGLLQDRDLYDYYRGLNDNFQKTGIKIRDEEALQTEGAETGDGADDEPEDVPAGKKGASGRPRY